MGEEEEAEEQPLAAVVVGDSGRRPTCKLKYFLYHKFTVIYPLLCDWTVAVAHGRKQRRKRSC